MRQTSALIFTLIGMAILCALGTWQVQRLAWKTEIIERLEAQYAQDPAPKLNGKTLEELGHELMPLAYGRVEGTFNYDKEIALGPKTQGEKIGFHILTPLRLADGGTILVNRGWREAKKETGAKCACNLPKRKTIVTGVARKPDWNRFTPHNSPSNDQWFRADIGQIAREKNLDNAAGVILYAENAQPPFIDTIPQDAKWFPRNKHLSYAIFWFTMAGILAVIGGIYIFSGRKKTAPSSGPR